jgi:uncharacterized membrane protein YheB (UPF0754 family)
LTLSLLIKLSPLLVATLHGYGAAWLAVKMLFRPLHPVYIWGRQLPLTPGMLPKERDRFISALSTAIASQLLNTDVIAGELAKLDLGREISALARQEYAQFTNNGATVAAVTDHLKQQLTRLSQDEEAKRIIARRLRLLLDRETANSGFIRRFAVVHLFDEDTLYGVLGKAADALVEGVEDNAYLRQTINDALVQIPQRLLAADNLVSSTAIGALVETLSRKLDVRQILVGRLTSLSNEEIEKLVMETAGKEIRAIVWFGAGIGFLVGVIQTLINFL